MTMSCKPTTAGVQPEIFCVEMKSNIYQIFYRCHAEGKTCILSSGYTSGISCF